MIIDDNFLQSCHIPRVSQRVRGPITHPFFCYATPSQARTTTGDAAAAGVEAAAGSQRTVVPPRAFGDNPDKAPRPQYQPQYGYRVDSSDGVYKLHDLRPKKKGGGGEEKEEDEERATAKPVSGEEVIRRLVSRLDTVKENAAKIAADADAANIPYHFCFVEMRPGARKVGDGHVTSLTVYRYFTGGLHTVEACTTTADDLGGVMLCAIKSEKYAQSAKQARRG